MSSLPAPYDKQPAGNTLFTVLLAGVTVATVGLAAPLTLPLMWFNHKGGKQRMREKFLKDAAQAGLSPDEYAARLNGEVSS